MLILRKTLLSLAVLSFCFCLALFFDTQPTNASPQSQDEFISLPVDESNVMSMTRLLDFAARTLKITILYDEADTSQKIFQFTGKVRVPRSQFPGYFERLILEKNFLFLVSGEGDSAVYRVVYLMNRGMGNPWHMKGRVVPLENLADYADRGLLVTVTIPLKYVDARNTLQSLNPYFMTQGPVQVESIRSVENANSLIITTFGQKAYQLYRLLQRLDHVAENEVEQWNVKLRKLQAKYDELEVRIKKLEQ